MQARHLEIDQADLGLFFLGDLDAHISGIGGINIITSCAEITIEEDGEFRLIIDGQDRRHLCRQVSRMRGWERQSKRGALTFLTIDSDSAIISLDDLANDEKAKPSPLAGFFGREEWVEYLPDFIDGDAAAIIHDLDNDRAVRRFTGQFYLTIFLVHRLGGIADDIKKHFLDLAFVSKYRRKL